LGQFRGEEHMKKSKGIDWLSTEDGDYRPRGAHQRGKDDGLRVLSSEECANKLPLEHHKRDVDPDALCEIEQIVIPSDSEDDVEILEVRQPHPLSEGLPHLPAFEERGEEVCEAPFAPPSTPPPYEVEDMNVEAPYALQPPPEREEGKDMSMEAPYALQPPPEHEEGKDMSMEAPYALQPPPEREEGKDMSMEAPYALQPPPEREEGKDMSMEAPNAPQPPAGVEHWALFSLDHMMENCRRLTYRQQMKISA
jgi:hypothetical protein